MRTIVKQPIPTALSQWRNLRTAEQSEEGMNCTYEELRRDKTVMDKVEEGLFLEQGGICAYTGHRLRRTSKSGHGAGFHIEHVIAQTHSKNANTSNEAKPDLPFLDTEYTNMIACWPEPNHIPEPTFGACRKGSWPLPAARSLFISPLHSDCTTRFTFNHRGEIRPTGTDDEAAKETIKQLGLDDKVLTALRTAAIKGVIGLKGKQIKLRDARKILRQLQQDLRSVDQGHGTQLSAFCFAIQPVLTREIIKLEAIQSRLQK